MKMYICQYPIGFPQSEYGGLLAVIAASPKALGKILTEAYGEDPYFNLSIAVRTVTYYELDPSKKYESGIVREFTT